jgi:hypothetical protein
LIEMQTCETLQPTAGEWSGVHRVLGRLLASAALVALPIACTGQIGGTAPRGALTGTGGSSTVPGGTAGTAGTLAAGAPAVAPDRANTVLRRLNRSEYNNTVRDLLGTSLRPADQLPNDETGAGFDTVGEVLSVSLQHIESFEQGATQLVDELFALPAADARRSAVLVCQLQAGMEEACARQILSPFVRRALRRPVSEAEISSLLQFVRQVADAGNSYEEGLKAALRSILLSPHFLYLVEKAPAVAAGQSAPLSDHELAARLSYFLWSSMPDAALSTAADAGGLAKDSAKLTAEVERMLADGKAAALTENFVGQWLTLRRLALVEPSPGTFPDYDVELRDAAVRETELFFDELLKVNAPIETLLSADFTFVNQRLGQHYGTPASGSEFQRVSLGGTERVGLLSQTSFLMANSHPAFTSPTKRGAWVLEQLLCDPPPAPPPNIDPLMEPVAGETVRQKLEAHRAQPACAACHTLMDPIGLGLENFDAIGSYHATQAGQPVNASGVLGDTQFSGVRELAALLSRDARLPTCFAQQMLTYAVGRTFQGSAGHSYADGLISGAPAAGLHGVRDLLGKVVQSEAFRTRRGE